MILVLTPTASENIRVVDCCVSAGTEDYGLISYWESGGKIGAAIWNFEADAAAREIRIGV